jgi:hypothetical protein
MRKIDALLNQTPDKHLFHYTSAHGLLGILDTRSIWASSVYHLNDSKEFRYPMDLMIERLQNRIKHEHGPNNETYGVVLKTLTDLTHRVQAFVACFSEDGDLLSQWLAYSGSGNGYAIGLSPDQFRSAIDAGFRLVRCVYEEDEQATMADAVIDVLCDQEQRDDQELLEKALVATAAIKHPGFRQEAEWRLVKPIGVGNGQMTGTKFRQGRNGIVPYLEAPMVPDKRQLIPNAIHLGPSDDTEAAQLAVFTLLDFHGLMPSLGERRVNVQPSKTPYRP